MIESRVALVLLCGLAAAGCGKQEEAAKPATAEKGATVMRQVVPDIAASLLSAFG